LPEGSPAIVLANALALVSSDSLPRGKESYRDAKVKSYLNVE